MADTQRSDAFPVYAWFITGFNMLVIAWGTVVRATGSGAGCGSHWPQCNGAIVPVLARLETAIEYGHRVSSALAGLLVLILVVWSFRRKGNGLSRSAAAVALVFILLEGIIGALLVRLELVAGNTSGLRAVVIALHLVNTLLLLAALALTAWAGRQHEPVHFSARTIIVVLLGIGMIGTAILSAAGAVTALGDTLFPAQSLATGLNADINPDSSFLIRLRVIHPLIAVVVSAYLLALAQYLLRRYEAPSIARNVKVLSVLVVLQVSAGFLNVLLLAPLWMQLVHLVLADCVWLALLLLTLETATQIAPSSQPAQSTSAAQV